MMRSCFLAALHITYLYTGYSLTADESQQVSISAAGQLMRRHEDSIDQAVKVQPSNEDALSTKVSVFRLKNMMVNCKGQLMTGSPGNWTPVDVHFQGCGFGRGTCGQEIWNKGPNDDKPGGPHGNLVVLTQPQWGAYYHMVIDSLSRFVWVKEQHPELLKSSTTYYHTGMTSETGQAWARLVGIDTKAGTGNGNHNRILEGSYYAKNVYYPPSNKCNTGGIGATPHAVQQMRALIHKSPAFLPYLKKANIKDEKKWLLIQRDPASSRALLNHDEVFEAIKAALPDWKHDVLSATNLPDVYRQCDMFYRAHLVLGPHGAGFSNIVCSKPGTPVIEFQQTPHSKDFELLAGKLDMPYFGIPTEINHLGRGNVSVDQVVDKIKVSVPKVQEMVLMAAKMIQLD